MTIEQRLEQVEQQNQHMQLQNQKIQRTNKRLTVALTMTVVAMAAVVTMAATELKDGHFDTVTARHIDRIAFFGPLRVRLFGVLYSPLD